MEDLLTVAGGGTTIGAALIWFIKTKLIKYDKEMALLKDKLAHEDKLNTLQKEQISNIREEIKYIKSMLK